MALSFENKDFLKAASPVICSMCDTIVRYQLGLNRVGGVFKAYTLCSRCIPRLIGQVAKEIEKPATHNEWGEIAP